MSQIIRPDEFEGSDSDRINQAIERAQHDGKRVVIPRINEDGEQRDRWLLDSAILVRENTVLELDSCHLKLSDDCRDNFIRSANCGIGITDITPIQNVHIRGIGTVILEGADHPRATGDSAKTLGERTYGTDAGNPDESQSGDWRNIGILMAYVENFSIENLHIKNSHCWAISLERCAHGTVRDIDFASTEHVVIDGNDEMILNQDGLDLRQGCHDITIDTITGFTGDDLIAFTAIPHGRKSGSLESTMISAAINRGDGLDDICNVSIRNVRGYCKGGHNIVRFLNTSGIGMHDISLDGLIDTSPRDTSPCATAVRIGDSNPVWGGVTPLGETSRFMISNVMSRSIETVLIAGSLSESSISNIMKYESPGDPICYKSGTEYTRNLQLTNITNCEDN
jgi:hypothetical protein